MSNALNITPTSHAKVVETENAMILMGNYYQKEDISCVSKKGCIFDNIQVGDNTLNISRFMNITNGYRLGFRHKMFDIIKDPYVTNRYYYVINNHYADINNTYSYLIIAEEDGDDINVIAKASQQHIDWERILDIDQNYLYATGTYLYDTGTYLYKIDKNTGVCNVIFQLTNSSRNKCNLIYKNETYIYFIVRHQYGITYVVRYNKNNGEVKNNIYTAPDLIAGDSTFVSDSSLLWMQYNLIDIENFYQENNKYYWCMPQHSGTKFTEGEGNANNNLMIMCFDPSQSFDDKDKVVTFRTTDGIQDNEKLIWSNNNNYSCYRFWIIDSYLYYAVYDETNEYNINMNTIQGIHVFKINKKFELEYVNKIQITTQKQIISMVYSSDKMTLLIGYYNSFEIYLYNSNTHLYEPMNKEIGNIASVGFDSMDRLWYQDLNGGVFVENLDDPQYVSIKFERIYYTYEGVDIDTYLTFEAKSFTDKIPTGLYTLRLTGNAYFKDNGIKVLTISYTGGIVKLDVVVTGPKRIVCDVEFQKVW